MLKRLRGLPVYRHQALVLFLVVGVVQDQQVLLFTIQLPAQVQFIHAFLLLGVMAAQVDLQPRQQVVVEVVPQGQMVPVLLVALIPLLQVVVEVVVTVVALVAQQAQPVQQELEPVLAVLVEQQAHQAAQVALALTQPQHMSFLAAAVAVLVTVQALQLVALAGIMVLAAAGALRLQPLLEALDHLVCWLLRTHRYCQRQ